MENVEVEKSSNVVPSRMEHTSNELSQNYQKPPLWEGETNYVLKKWLSENLTKPYPSEGEKVQMAQESGLTRAQVNMWFKNARRKMAKE